MFHTYSIDKYINSVIANIINILQHIYKYNILLISINKSISYKYTAKYWYIWWYKFSK